MRDPFFLLLFFFSLLLIPFPDISAQYPVSRSQSAVAGPGQGNQRLASSIKHPVPSTSLNYLFQSGTEGYHTFRIPAIITTTEGVVLAFAEGRKKGSSDTGDIDLVMRRSEDNGRTWSPLRVLWDDGENVCGNPAPVVDRETGDIFLLSTWNLGIDHESEIIRQESEDTRRVFVLSVRSGR